MVKSGKKMSVMEAKGKLASLEDLIKDMDNMSMGKMKGKKGMAKISVMSDSPEGLKEGLETAGDVVEDESEEGSEESCEVTLPKFGSKQKSGALMEEEEFEEDSQDDSKDSSEEELDRKIAELMAKKKSKQSKLV